MSFSRWKNFFLERTEGDGNCAFNAFILGLSRQSVIENMESGFIQAGEDPNVSMSDFIRGAASQLNVPSRWLNVKNELLHLRQESAVLLQNKFAPVLRDLAINLAERDACHPGRTIEPLLSAFNDFVNAQKPVVDVDHEKKETSNVEDDIFKHHSFIQHKFSEFYAKRHLSNNIEKELEAWWFGYGASSSGYQQFLKEMKKERMWAGDLELFQLARYFRINLDVLRKDFVHRIYSHSGKVPSHHFTDEQIAQLIDRQVINEPTPGDEELTFLPLTKDEVEQRLQVLPEFEAVAWYIVENEFIKGLPIPTHWSACLQPLWTRNLIEKKNDHYVFSVDRDVAMKYAAAIPGYDHIMSLWNLYHLKSPTVTLSNPEAVHWSNVLPVEEKPSDNAIYDYYKYFLSFVRDRVFSKPTPKKSPLLFNQVFFKEAASNIAASSDEDYRKSRDFEM